MEDEPQKSFIRDHYFLFIALIFVAFVVVVGFVLALILVFYNKKKDKQKEEPKVKTAANNDEETLEKLIKSTERSAHANASAHANNNSTENKSMQNTNEISADNEYIAAVITVHEKKHEQPSEEKIQIMDDTEYNSSQDN